MRPALSAAWMFAMLLAVAGNAAAQPAPAGTASTHVLAPRTPGDLARALAQPADAPLRIASIRADAATIRLTLEQPDGRHVDLALDDPATPCTDCVRARWFAIGFAAGDATAREVADDVRARLDAGLATDPWETPATSADGGGIARATDSPPERPGLLADDPIHVAVLFALWIPFFWLFGGLVSRAVRVLASPERRTLAVVFAVSLALRVAFGVFGPGDLALNLFLPDYGLAPAALLAPLLLALPAPLVVLPWVSLALGTLAPAVLFLLVREVASSSRAATAAALVYALQPLAIRFSGDGERQAYVILLMLAAIWAAHRFATSRSRRDLALYALAAALCANSRPEGLSVLLLGPAVTLFVARLDRWALVAVAVELAVAGIVLATLPPEMRARMDLVAVSPGLAGWLAFDPDYRPWLDAAYTAPVGMGLAALGLVAGLVLDTRLAVGAALFVVGFSAWAGFCPSGEGALSSARYHSQSMLFFSVLAGLGMSYTSRAFHRVAGARVGTVLVAGLWMALAASTVAPLLDVCAPRTVDREYRFLARTVPTLPRGASVAYLYPTNEGPHDIGFKSPMLIPALVGRPDVRFVTGPVEPASPGRPAFYYHAPACSVIAFDPTEGTGRPGPVQDPRRQPALRGLRDRCDDLLARTAAHPFATEDVEARPFAREVYERSTLRFGLYELGPGGATSR